MIKIIKNSKSRNKVSKTPYKGITIDNKTGNYRANLYVSHNKNKILVDIGTFSTEKEAVKARINYILSLL